jgi:hypothetical protein
MHPINPPCPLLAKKCHSVSNLIRLRHPWSHGRLVDNRLQNLHLLLARRSKAFCPRWTWADGVDCAAVFGWELLGPGSWSVGNS